MEELVEDSSGLEHERENHANRDDVSDVWHKEDGLEKFLKYFDAIDCDCDN